MNMRRLVLLGLTLLLTVQADALTLSQLETQTRILLRDSSSDVAFQRFSNATIDGFLNEAQRQMNNDSWLYVGNDGVGGVIAGIQEYNLPPDYVAMVRVTLANVALTQVSRAGLDGGGSNQGFGSPGFNWTIATSTPTEFYINDYTSIFTPGTPSTIGFYPTPKVSGGPLNVEYVKQVPLLINSTDVPFAGKPELLPYHDALADFAAARCWQLLGRADMATFLMTLYASRAKQARDNLNRMPDFLPGASGNRGPKQ